MNNQFSGPNAWGDYLTALEQATPVIEAHNACAWAQYTVQLDGRDAVQASLKTAGIPTAVHYPIPLNRQPAVADDGVSLPVGDAVAERVMSVPMHPYLDEAAISRVVDTVRQCQAA